jgi:hypothetical protein
MWLLHPISGTNNPLFLYLHVLNGHEILFCTDTNFMHSARGSSNVQRSFQIVEQNLTRIAEGKPLFNVVNRSKGY